MASKRFSSEAARRRWYAQPEEWRREHMRLMNERSNRHRRGKFSYCTVAGCEAKMEAKELCEAHYQQMRRHGRIKRVDVRRYSKRTSA
jgi:hypothetical protein